MPNALLEIDRVRKNYDKHLALDSVSFTVEQGAIFGLLGPNGAGKTSLIRIINRITAADQGEIRFQGKALADTHTALIGYLPEERGLYKKMEVGEQALYLAQLKGLSRNEALKRLKFWFEKLEIASWWRKKVDELSKGMQQKVQFIVTVVHEPLLLILDEPFTGFDPINAGIIKDELLRLHQQGATVILSTHRMESVEQLCSHIALLHRSTLVLNDSVPAIRKSFRQNLFRIQYQGTAIALANSLWNGHELVSNEPKADYNEALIRLLPGSSTNDLIAALLPNISISHFAEVLPDMNEIFIRSVSQNTVQ